MNSVSVLALFSLLLVAVAASEVVDHSIATSEVVAASPVEMQEPKDAEELRQVKFTGTIELPDDLCSCGVTAAAEKAAKAITKTITTKDGKTKTIVIQQGKTKGGKSCACKQPTATDGLISGRKFQRIRDRISSRLSKFENNLQKDLARVKAASNKMSDNFEQKTGNYLKTSLELGRRMRFLERSPGKRGPPGPKGPTGIRGAPGDKGPNGPQGARGPQGREGKPGPRGRRGPRGPRGPRGNVGRPGSPGPPGKRGPTGRQGPTGFQGPRGLIGPAGPRGLPGRPGKAGGVGRPGQMGPQGAIGAQGPRGPRGSRGLRGARGPTGFVGKRGPEGARGSRGRPGIVGIVGRQGLAGPRGPQGRRGRPGKPGPRGKQGPRGPRGRAGRVIRIGGRRRGGRRGRRGGRRGRRGRRGGKRRRRRGRKGGKRRRRRGRKGGKRRRRRGRKGGKRRRRTRKTTRKVRRLSKKQDAKCGKGCKWLKKHKSLLKEMHVSKKWQKELIKHKSLREKYGLTPKKMKKIERKVERRVEANRPPPRITTVIHHHVPRRRCFPSSAQVTLASGVKKSMSQLVHGDKVLTLNAQHVAEFKDIFFFGHRDNKVVADYTCLSTKAQGKLCLSEDHYLLASSTESVGNARYMRAKDAKVGMFVWQMMGANVVNSEIVNIAIEKMQGEFNPYTLDNNLIVVDGVVASTHSSWFLDDVVPVSYTPYLPYVYDVALAPAQYLYRLMGAQWAAGVQERLPLDNMAVEEPSLLSLVKPYASLLSAELPAISRKMFSSEL